MNNIEEEKGCKSGLKSVAEVNKGKLKAFKIFKKQRIFSEIPNLFFDVSPGLSQDAYNFLLTRTKTNMGIRNKPCLYVKKKTLFKHTFDLQILDRIYVLFEFSSKGVSLDLLKHQRKVW